jgi:uncharacterized membrane protein YdbT with pleckstrin-like domain
MNSLDNNSYQCRLHWVIFLKPMLLLIIPMFFHYFGFYIKQLYMVFAFVALIWLIFEMVTFSFTSLTIKPQNVVFKSGFLVQQTIDLPMKRIESIDFRQNILGAILNYGDLIITGSGGTRQVISYIENPLTCRRYIEQFLNSQA